ncbi:hypothetical protein F8M41_001873 [Gigaspora margarita]|uniref:Uncharacterized protein n=1 Tax=Gigaspora margarita TaxID=4874 RepID=A0A8H4A7F7_GIGMA|nr:hypothetical protein F8M41_001873 [Gigaspora margarita]
MQQINHDTETILMAELTGAGNSGSSNQRAAATAAQSTQYSNIWVTWKDDLKGFNRACSSVFNVKLTAISFVCELIIQSGAILTAVVSGARKEEPKCHELVLSL